MRCWPSQHGGLTPPTSGIFSVLLRHHALSFSRSMKTINNPLTRGTVEDLSQIWVTYIIIRQNRSDHFQHKESLVNAAVDKFTSENEEPGDFGVKRQEVRRFHPLLSILVGLYYCILTFTHYRGGFKSVMQDWSLVPPPLSSLSPSALALCLGGSSPGRAQ